MATIKDVAKKAGVSTATVSRIINGKGEASVETIQRVNKIIKELDYKPSSIAKSLSKKESDLIALLIPNIDNPFFGELVNAIETTANKKGYHIYLCNSQDDRDKVRYYIDTMIDQYVAGAIFSTLFVTQDDLKRLEQNRIHTITIDRSQFDHPYSSVTVDHKKGGYLATNHLIQQGCKKILFLSGPKDESSSQQRYQGYCDAIKKAGLEFEKVIYGDFNIESGYSEVDKYLLKKQDIDGIFCSNDAMALGAISACSQNGIQVPKDIEVVGYDNILFSKFSNPKLTTINQSMSKIGTIVIDELDRLIKNNEKVNKYVVDPELIIRDSTKRR